MTVQSLFQKHFELKRKSVHGFSLRALARKMGLSPSYLSRLLRGEKPLPEKLLMPLARALDVSPEVVANFKGNSPVEKETETETSDWELSPATSHRVLTQWYYIPLLELTSLKNFDGRIETLAERLGVSPASVEVAVRELVALDLLKWEEGRLRKVKRKLRFSSAKSLTAIRSFHAQFLLRAREELTQKTLQEDFERRLITGITLTVPADKVEEAKRRLAECLHEISNDLTAESGDEVYHLAAQFFPITKPKESK